MSEAEGDAFLAAIAREEWEGAANLYDLAANSLEPLSKESIQAEEKFLALIDEWYERLRTESISNRDF